MSLILNTLRRSIEGEARHPVVGSRYERVLEVFGYRGKGSHLSSKALVLCGIGALSVGFFAVFLIVVLFAPSERVSEEMAARLGASRRDVVAPANSLFGQQEPPESSALSTVDATSGPPIVPASKTPPTVSATSQALARQAADVSAVEPKLSLPQTPPPVAPSLARKTAVPTSTKPPLIELEHQPAPSVSLSPDHFGLALYHQRLGDFERALAQYQALLEQNDRSAEVHNNLGLLYQEHGDTEQAIEQFRKAIAIAPRHAKAHNNLGVAELQLGHVEAAAAELRVALEAEPHNVESMVNLALVHKAAGRMADARELLRHAVEVDPRHAGARYNLAVIADEQGDIVIAVQHYRAFLRLGTIEHGNLTEQVRARLSALGT